MTDGLSLVQVLDIISKIGVTGLLALMWWMERKERLRLQRILEGYLMPMVENAAKAMRGVRKAVTGGDGD